MAEMAEGEEFVGPSRTLTDAHFFAFSGLSGDLHPIHHDVEYAKATVFGQPVAHGLHLAALTALGASDGRSRAEGMAFVEQGSKFLKPAMVGDTLLPKLRLVRKWEEQGRRFYRFETKLLNQRGETVLEGFHVYCRIRDDDGEKAQ